MMMFLRRLAFLMCCLLPLGCGSSSGEPVDGRNGTTSSRAVGESAAVAALGQADNDAADAEQGDNITLPEQEAAPEESPATTPRPSLRLASNREERTSDITFEDLDFDIEADAPFDRDLLTEEIEALHGTKVRLRGFMLPAYSEEGIDEFVLVKDNQICCFGPGARICHNAMVAMVPGRFASYTTRVVIVEGEFRIEEWTGPDGVVYSCFRIIATSVETDVADFFFVRRRSQYRAISLSGAAWQTRPAPSVMVE